MKQLKNNLKQNQMSETTNIEIVTKDIVKSILTEGKEQTQITSLYLTFSNKANLATVSNKTGNTLSDIANKALTLLFEQPEIRKLLE